MNQPEHRRIPKPIAALALAGMLVLSAVAPTLASAGIDLGTVSLGASSNQDVNLPLEYALSDVPADTIIYSGGDSGMDLILAAAGLSAPVTAGDLYGVAGEVTGTFHLTLSASGSSDFGVDDGDCPSATGTCTATVTFTPTAAGTENAVIAAHIADLQVSGGGAYSSLISAVAPSLVPSFEDQIGFDATGAGVDPSGTVSAQVTIPSSAACLELSATAIDFGTLALGSEDQPASPDVTVTNCSGVSGDIYASGTDADDGAGAHWSLTDGQATCADMLGTDEYRLGLEQSGNEIGLGTTNTLLETLASGAGSTHTARIFTACPGSSGSGSTMSMQITFLATTGS